MPSPLLSYIIPYFNGQDTIERQLDSIYSIPLEEGELGRNTNYHKCSLKIKYSNCSVGAKSQYSTNATSCKLWSFRLAG